MSQPRSFRIQQDDKFFSRLLSKESSMANPSSRLLYYANRPSSVPFLWESQPGRRKPSMIFNHDDHHDHDHNHNHNDHDDHHDHNHDHEHSHGHVPPLTPPPYYTKQKFAQKIDTPSSNHDRFDHQRHCRYKRSRSSGLLSSLFPKKFKIIANFGLKIRARQWISSASEGSGSVIDSVTFRSCSTTTTSWFSSSALSFDSRGDEEEEYDDNLYDDDDDDNDDSSNSRICFGCYRG